MNNNLKSIKLYKNAFLLKKEIFKENKNKSGIYKWINNINNKIYIGSSKDLSNRMRKYYSEYYINKKIQITRNKLYKDILMYKLENFSLEILEYCEKDLVLKREQYYLDYFKPQYNILKIAGSSLGFKHSLSTILKLKNRKFKTGYSILVLNKSNNVTEEFCSLRKAAKAIGTHHTSISPYLNTNKLFKNLYLIISNTKLRSSKSNNSINIKVLDILSNKIIIFPSIRGAAKYIGLEQDTIISPSTISRYIKSGDKYKCRYIFSSLN